MKIERLPMAHTYAAYTARCGMTTVIRDALIIDSVRIEFASPGQPPTVVVMSTDGAAVLIQMLTEALEAVKEEE